MYVKGFCIALFFLTACNPTDSASTTKPASPATERISSSNIIKRQPYNSIAEIPLPAKFKRVNTQANNFDYYLQHLPLKEDATVYLFNGTMKGNQSAQFAVLDISVSNENLQQCADAIMRLRAEYLYALQAYDQLDFRDNENTSYKFTKSPTRQNFDKYLRTVFGMCGTASLSKQMNKVNSQDIKIGDVLIRGGFPGHAVIVMDMAKNDKGEEIYLLAQSYMPAQDIHILKNPSNSDLSPWYAVNNETDIHTPEYSFKKTEWKTWP